MSMMIIIPLPHYDNFLNKFFKSEHRFAPPPPPHNFDNLKNSYVMQGGADPGFLFREGARDYVCSRNITSATVARSLSGFLSSLVLSELYFICIMIHNGIQKKNIQVDPILGGRAPVTPPSGSATVQE